MKTIRFGIIGTGRITRRFMADFHRAEAVALSAVCSTALEKAERFAAQYQAPHAFDNVQDFIDRGEIDVAYVATAHPYHMEFALECLRAGIPVLCEKPITVNAAQLGLLIGAARETNTFLMEAYWTRFFPLTLQVLDWVQSEAIGEIVLMEGGFTGCARREAGSRLFEPSLAGGALLDVGVYPLQYALLAAGVRPAQMASLAHLAGGVDETSGMVLTFPSGAMAVLHTSIVSGGRDGFTIQGTRGSIEIPGEFWRPRRATLHNDQGDTALTSTFEGEGFQFEIAHVADCVRTGLSASPLMPLEQSLQVMETCDALRQSWGLKYPFE